MWSISEHRGIGRTLNSLPPQAGRRYELWKLLVFRHGPRKLQEFPGYGDERMKAAKDRRASRLAPGYRVIYAADREINSVFVLEITTDK